MTSLVIADVASDDIDTIIDYLEREAGRATAAAYAERFTAEIERIADFPGHGTLRPALGPDTRVSLVYPYLVIYDYTASLDQATLLRVLHGKREITERLMQRAAKA